MATNILAQAKKIAKEIEKSRNMLRDLKEEILAAVADGKQINADDLREVRDLLITDRIEAAALRDDFVAILQSIEQSGVTP